MSDETERNTGAIERLVDELKAVRDSVEQLYVLLDHVWRNREELRNVLSPSPVEPTVSESIACAHCDVDPPDSLAAAVQTGWSRLAVDDGPGWNYIGVCPTCQNEERVKEEAEAKRKGEGHGESHGESQSTLF